MEIKGLINLKAANKSISVDLFAPLLISHLNKWINLHPRVD